MSTELSPTPKTPAKPGGKRVRRRGKPSVGTAMLARGEPWIWLTGGALAVSLIMIVGLLGMVIWLGVGTFYPQPIQHVVLHDGTIHMGEVTKQNDYPIDATAIAMESEPIVRALVASLVASLGDDVESRIPTALDTINERLAARELELTEKLKAADERLEQYRAQLATDGDSAFAKAEHIRAYGKIDAFKDTQALKLTLAGELDSVTFAQKANLEAKSYYTAKHAAGEAAKSLAEKIVAAPYDTKMAGLQSLLALHEQQEGTAPATRRRLLRTGNFKLTGVHFDWVSDYQIVPEGETSPEWAVLIEQQEGGRFYGMPARFEFDRDRVVSQEERELIEIGQFLAANAHRIEDEELKQAVNAEQANLAKQLRKLRKASTTTLLKTIDTKSGSTFVVETAAGERLPIDEIPAEAEVHKLVEIIEGEQPAFAQFAQHHPACRERFEQLVTLKEHALGTINNRQDELRSQVIAAQLAENRRGFFVALSDEMSAEPTEAEHLSPDAALELISELATLEQQLAGYRQSVEQANATVSLIGKRKGKQDITKSLAAIVTQITSEAVEQTERLETSKTELEAKLEQLPESVQEAAKRYLDYRLEFTELAEQTNKEINELEQQNDDFRLIMKTAQDEEATLPVGEIVRAYPANRLSFSDKLGVYFSRVWEFLAADPREANSEGGVFPAIWGTIAMTLVMTVFVAPFGVLAALYLREYAKAGPIVSVIRISINNLAGVPSIVFGVFGFGFFINGVGGWVDAGAQEMSMNIIPWLLWLAVAAVISIGAFVLGLLAAAGHPGTHRKFKRILRTVSFTCWLISVGIFVGMLFFIPEEVFSGAFAASAYENKPVFGKGGILWAALTLALLTLPVVIVATEEALSAVPNSMREGSYGCGAGKWQTIRRIVLPHALPGIMTGMILAMARGAGEVAPLMLVGAVKLAPELPLDASFPFLHADRSFMHLGFHIYDLGFQSQNSEAARPMVFTTTLLLIAIIFCLNMAAIWLRATLRKRFQKAQF